MNRSIFGSNGLLLSTPVRGKIVESKKDHMNNSSDNQVDSAFQLYCQQNLSPIHTVGFNNIDEGTPDSTLKPPHYLRNGYKASKTSLLSPHHRQQSSCLSKFSIQPSSLAAGEDPSDLIGSFFKNKPVQLPINMPSTDQSRAITDISIESFFHGIPTIGDSNLGIELIHGVAKIKQTSTDGYQSDKLYSFASPVFKIKLGDSINQLDTLLDSGDLQKGIIDDFNYIGSRIHRSFLPKVSTQTKEPLQMVSNHAYKRVIEFDENEYEGENDQNHLSSAVKMYNNSNSIEKEIAKPSQKQIKDIEAESIINEPNPANLFEESVHSHPFQPFFGYLPYQGTASFQQPPFIPHSIPSYSAPLPLYSNDLWLINKQSASITNEEKEQNTNGQKSLSTAPTIAKHYQKGAQQNSQKRKLFESPESKGISTPAIKKKIKVSEDVETILSTIIVTSEPTDLEKKGDMSGEEQKQEERAVDGQQAMTIEEPLAVAAVPKKICCNCKRTKCLKLYCECFAASRICEGCSCQGCYNKPEFEQMRIEARAAILERNMSAFDPKIDNSKVQQLCSEDGIDYEEKVHSKGCNCKKSNCLKKYCECFQLGVKCTKLCKCENCKNISGNGQNFPPMDDLVGHSHAQPKATVEVAQESVVKLPIDMQQQQHQDQISNYNYYCDDAYYQYYYPAGFTPTNAAHEPVQIGNSFQYYREYYPYAEHIVEPTDPMCSLYQMGQQFMEGNSYPVQNAANEEKAEVIVDDKEAEKKPQVKTASEKAIEAGMNTISTKKAKRQRSQADPNKETKLIVGETRKKNAIVLSANEPAAVKLDFSVDVTTETIASDEAKELVKKEVEQQMVQTKEIEIETITEIVELKAKEPVLVANSHPVANELVENPNVTPSMVTPAKRSSARNAKVLAKDSSQKTPVQLAQSDSLPTTATKKAETHLTVPLRHSSRLSGTKRA